LIAAAAVLEIVARLPTKLVMVVIVTAWTAEAIRPASGRHRSSTFIFRTILLKKRKHGQTTLKLDSVDGHAYFPQYRRPLRNKLSNQVLF
jgi:hypothetical protein